jgi:hypothetical protein
MQEQTEKFSLDGDPRRNYINLILNDMKNFNFFYAMQRDCLSTARALRALLLDMPPEGQKCMKAEIDDLVEWRNSKIINSYSGMGAIYQKAMDWLWTNILQDTFRAKPLSTAKAHMGADK